MPDDHQDAADELQALRNRVAQLERQLTEPPPPWQPEGFYTMYHMTTGFFLGIFGALASLGWNVVGSLLVGQSPLQLIHVYLTFPLGAQALSEEFDSTLALAVGCCLYLATGMVLGVPFQLTFARWMSKSRLMARLVAATFMGILLWVVNFYLILSWLQPMLFDGNWIVESIPPLVGASTHIVFGWTMAIVYPLGTFTPYRAESP